jgi:hypothetical protein
VISCLDEYSQYIVHQEVLLGMNGLSTNLATQRAIEDFAKGPRCEAASGARDPLGPWKRLHLQ